MHASRGVSSTTATVLLYDCAHVMSALRSQLAGKGHGARRVVSDGAGSDMLLLMLIMPRVTTGLLTVHTYMERRRH